MNYNTLLDMAADLGYRLAINGAETYRVEDSVNRILAAYGVESEVFAIPNSLIVGIVTDEGKPMTRMRRIGFHGNDLDAVERYNDLSRHICTEKPDPQTAVEWMDQVDHSRTRYSFLVQLLGYALVSVGFSVLFGGTLIDALCSGICGILVGLANRLMAYLEVNEFFSTIVGAFIMAFSAYAMYATGIPDNVDMVIIGALMLLVPGLLFTNAMRDIIFGDTNSGVNRIAQVFLVAAAIALGTGTAWTVARWIWGNVSVVTVIPHPYWIQVIGGMIGCYGFSLIFNIHGSGFLLCILGGGISWATYCVVHYFTGNDILATFCASAISAAYAEAIARIRKYPAISYLVVSLLPLIPGAGLYYTSNYIVRGNMSMFASKGTHTIAIAGAIAVGILLVSTLMRLSFTIKKKRLLKKKASVI